MKRTVLIILSLGIGMLVQAQVSKTVNETTAGTLSTLLTANELVTVTNLTITGTIDKRDFTTMRDNMPALSVVDISGTTIASVTISIGMMNNTFPANAVPDSAFYNTFTSVSKVSLTSIVLPSSATTIGTDAFRGCTGLTSIIIPSQVTTLRMMAFDGCTGLKSVTIPSTVINYGLEDFYNCTGLTAIYSTATTPVDLSSVSSVFGNVSTSACTLYVPIGSKTAYASANQWMAFANIIETSTPTGISALADEKVALYPNPATTYFNINVDAMVKVYTSNGVAVLSAQVKGNEPVATGNLKAGLYVVKIITGNGVTTKSLIVR